MKDSDDSGCIPMILFVIFLLAVTAFATATVVYGTAIDEVCKGLGWDGGWKKKQGWFVGYCYERNEDSWQGRECDLQPILAGACEPMWPDAE